MWDFKAAYNPKTGKYENLTLQQQCVFACDYPTMVELLSPRPDDSIFEEAIFQSRGYALGFIKKPAVKFQVLAIERSDCYMLLVPYVDLENMFVQEALVKKAISAIKKHDDRLGVDFSATCYKDLFRLLKNVQNWCPSAKKLVTSFCPETVRYINMPAQVVASKNIKIR